MDFLLHVKPRISKIKTLKGKIIFPMPMQTSMSMLMAIFRNDPGKTTVNYSGKNIQMQTIESEHYSQGFEWYLHLISLKLENKSEVGEQHCAFGFSYRLLICFSLFTIFFMLTFCTCCTKNCFVLQKKTGCVNKKNIPHGS